MKINRVRNVLLLFLPFFFMILVNEYSRLRSNEKPYHKMGVTFINSEVWSKEKYSWACHNSSAFCEKHNIQYMRGVKSYIDPVYFGIIRALKSTGYYGIANNIFLVVGYPLLIWYLLISCHKMRDRLKSHSL